MFDYLLLFVVRNINIFLLRSRKILSFVSHGGKLSKFRIPHPYIKVVVLNSTLLSLCNINYETVDKCLILDIV